MKPNFFLIGSAKCATTSFCSLLGKHPQVFMCDPKEPSFFNDDAWFSRGFAEYEALFADSAGYPLRGEGSTRYTVREVYPNAAERLAAYAPDAKLVYLVRHPMRRVEAAWMEIRSWGDKRDTTVHWDFDEAVRRDRAWLVDSANYLRELELYRRYYPDNQIQVLFFEDFKADAEKTLQQCLSFLGADTGLAIEEGPRHLNPSAGKTAPGGFLSFVRSQAWLRRVVRLVPESMRAAFGDRFLIKELKQRPNWKPPTRQWVIDQIGADTAEFLQRYGKPAGFWDLTA